MPNTLENDSICKNQNTLIEFNKNKYNTITAASESNSTSTVTNSTQNSQNSVQNESITTVASVNSKTKLIKHNINSKTNSNYILLSQRKLVRLRKNSKINAASTSSLKSSLLSKRKILSPDLKKTKVCPKSIIYNTSNKSLINNRSKFIINPDSRKMHWFNKKSIPKSCCKKKILINKKNL